jgi:hypothetical protein
MAGREIMFEGFSQDQILALPPSDIESLVLTGEPLVLRIGSATILGKFRVTNGLLRVELAQIEEGGEGVLVALWVLARRFAGLRGLSGVEWIVHAIHCASPNMKLRRVLQKRGFSIRNVEGSGEAYYFMDFLASTRPHKI